MDYFVEQFKQIDIVRFLTEMRLEQMINSSL